MNTHHPSLIVSLGIGALVCWRLYARVRRMVGRQKLSTKRAWATVVLFPLLAVLIALGTFAHPLTLAALTAGLAVGAGLGMYGLRLTTFEVTPLGRFYTPNAHLGIALSLLFIGRVLYRLAQVYFLMDMVDSGGPPSPDDFARSPLTLAIFGTLAGYYVAYAIGLIRWSRQASQTPDSTPT